MEISEEETKEEQNTFFDKQLLNLFKQPIMQMIHQRLFVIQHNETPLNDKHLERNKSK